MVQNDGIIRFFCFFRAGVSFQLSASYFLPGECFVLGHRVISFIRDMVSLKTHREDMIQQFMADQNLSWISSLHSRHDCEVTSGSKAETEDLKRWQLRAELKLEHLKFDDALLKAEMDRVPSSPHPNKVWADAGENMFHSSRFKNIQSALDTSTVGEVSSAAATTTPVEEKEREAVAYHPRKLPWLAGKSHCHVSFRECTPQKPNMSPENQ